MLTSCSSDDMNDYSLITDEYTQPNLDFKLLDNELYEILGLPDDKIQTEDFIVAKYSINSNGVSEHVYYLISNPDTPNDFRYYKVDVRFFNSQYNFDYMIELLTNKFGSPEITESLDTETKSYSWNIESTLYIQLYYAPDSSAKSNQGGNLILTYQILSL